MGFHLTGTCFTGSGLGLLRSACHLLREVVKLVLEHMLYALRAYLSVSFKFFARLTKNKSSPPTKELNLGALGHDHDACAL